jgi:hypothetical protein
MADETNHSNLSSLTLDLTALSAFLVDLPPGGLKGLQSEKDDYAKASSELNGINPALRTRLGIAADIEAIQLSDEHIKQIDERLPLALKMVEVLRETRAKEIDRRERKISTLCDKVQTHVKDTKEETTLAAFTETTKYRSQLADKAAKTRQKNAEAKDDTKTEEK